MDFWDNASSRLIANHHKKSRDLWLPPPKVVSEAFPIYNKHGWAKSVSHDNGNTSIFRALRSYRVFGYWTGLLPVQSVLTDNPQDLHFRWFSRAICIPVMFIMLFVGVLAYRMYTIIRYSMFGTIDSMAYIIGPVFWGFFTLRQASLFPALIKKFDKVEDEMKTIGKLHKLKKHLNIITALNIIATMGSIFNLQITWYQTIANCSEDIITKIQLTMYAAFTSLFFSPGNSFCWGSPIFFLVQVYYRVIWTFAELTFIVLSYSLHQLFKLYVDHLEKFRDKNMNEQFWYRARVLYNSLSRLTKALDRFLSPNTCITFAINIFFICFVLFHVFTGNPLKHKMLFYFLLYAIFRILVIALLGSYIHELSKKPLLVLYSVPSKSFCCEVLRFQLEILADDISLTGCRFFSITRSFMVAVFGTIATYEIVLLQFGSIRVETFNATAICSAYASYYLDHTNDSLY